jgi:hypothetical protein
MSRQPHYGGAIDDALLSLRDPAITDAQDQWMRQLAMQINNSVSVASANLAVVSETLEAHEAASLDIQDALTDARSAILRIAALAAMLATRNR